jgi:hypothetical protein
LLAARVLALAADTCWPEERILHMPLARLARYPHCLLRRNGVRINWGGTGDVRGSSTHEQLEAQRGRWVAQGCD